MKIIGLTGGIGSGKSTVRKIFETLGISTYDADTNSKEIVNSNKNIILKLKELFGNEIYLSNNTLNKELLAKYIFNDKETLNKVNNIIHPEVQKHFTNWTLEQKTKYVIKEAAILFESGAHKFTDKIILVTAPEQLRIDRVLHRDGKSAAEIKKIIDNQLSDTEKIKISDFIIYNDNQKLIIPQVIKIHEILSK